MQKEAQVWIESVLYTLIGLAIIGLLLIAARPKISSTQDQFIIQQTIRALNEFDNKIIEIKQATGNRRIIHFQLSKGELLIDAENDKVQWKLFGSTYMYSEPGTTAWINNIRVYTEKKGDVYDVELTLDYQGSNDLTIEMQEKSRTLQAAKTPYSITLENYGQDTQTGLIKIDINVG
jgi:type II secretory pathway pseudopilin PulG